MEAYLGEIRTFAFGTIPKGWTACNGQALPIRSNQALYALLGTQYGGDGVNTFNLPNLQGNVMVGAGTGNGLTLNIGQTGGSTSVTLTTPQLPAHNHPVQAAETLGSQALGGTNDYLSQVGVYVSNIQSQLYAVNAYSNQSTGITPLTPNTITVTGAGQSHENRMPYQALNVCIAVTGIFPSRN
jgi:microcystin-dependent protein